MNLCSLEKELDVMRVYVDVIQSCKDEVKGRAVDVRTDERNIQPEQHIVEKRKKKSDGER